MRLAAALALVLIASGRSSAQDAFEQRRAAELAAMTGVDPIYLAFDETRPSYRLGEPIRLSVEFAAVGRKPVTGGGCTEGMLTVILDKPDSAVDWRTLAWRDPRDHFVSGGGCGDEYSPQVFQYAGPVFPPLGAEYDRPILPLLVHERMDLTDLIRFDAPGRYRFYVRTAFRSPIERTPPRLSNILTVEIAPRDAEWEAGVLAAAAHDLQSHDARRRRAAFRRVSRIASREAVDLVASLDDDSLADMAWTARDRQHVVARMADRLDDVTRAIDWRFLWTLAAADASMQGPRPAPPSAVEARLRVHSARRLKALDAAGRLDSALGATMFHAVRAVGDRVAWQLPAAGFSAVARAVSRALLALPPAEQRLILADQRGWREFADAAFLPMFRQIARDRRPGGAQEVAWAMWHHLEPAEAQAFRRREVGRRGPSVQGLPHQGGGTRTVADADSAPWIAVEPPMRPGAPPTFILPGWADVVGVRALRDRLALWPPGTHWTFTPQLRWTGVPGLHPTTLWLPGEEETMRADVRSAVESLGMTISVP